MHEATPKPINPDSLKHGYERTDLNASLVWISLFGILTLMVAAGFVILLMMRGFEESRDIPDEVAPVAFKSMMGTQTVVDGYAGPLLQLNPEADRVAYDEASVAKRDSWGYQGEQSEDATPTMGHMPIEKAMQEIVDGTAPYKLEPQTALIGQ